MRQERATQEGRCRERDTAAQERIKDGLRDRAQRRLGEGPSREKRWREC